MTPAHHTKSSSYYYFRHVAMLQKFAGPLVGAPFFVGASVWPNMLNMPKSASRVIGAVDILSAENRFFLLYRRFT